MTAMVSALRRVDFAKLESASDSLEASGKGLWFLRRRLSPEIFDQISAALRSLFSLSASPTQLEMSIHLLTLAVAPVGEDWKALAMQSFDAVLRGKVRGGHREAHPSVFLSDRIVVSPLFSC